MKTPMRVTVLGAAGYVGAAVYEAIREHFKERVQLLGIDIRPSPQTDREVDLSPVRSWKKMCPTFEDVVFNFAGVASIKAAADDPGMALAMNQRAPARLQAALRPKLFVHFSSCSVYGPETVYGTTKEKGELKGAGTVNVRLGTVVGLSPSRYLRLDTPINKMVWRAVQGKPLCVPGSGGMRPYVAISTVERWCEELLGMYEAGVISGRQCTTMPLIDCNLTLRAAAELVKDRVEERASRVEVKREVRDVQGYGWPSTARWDSLYHEVGNLVYVLKAANAPEEGWLIAEEDR